MAAERVSDLPTQGEPGPFQRRVFLWASLLYGAIVAAVLPWVTVPGPQNPLVAVVAAIAVAVSDFLTALLLFHWHKRRSRLSIIVLCGGYLYSGALCLLNMAAIPGTLGLGFASDHMAAGLYLLWRFGAALAYFAAVWLEGAGREWTQGRQVTRPLQVRAQLSWSPVRSCAF